jgi:hypothetical protein
MLKTHIKFLINQSLTGFFGIFYYKSAFLARMLHLLNFFHEKLTPDKFPLNCLTGTGFPINKHHPGGSLLCFSILLA